MTLSHPLTSGTTLCADVCEECDTLGKQLLERLAPAAATLRDGDSTLVELDWATLRLRAESGRVWVDEPDDFNAGSWLDRSLIRTSQIFLLQRKLLDTLQVVGEPVTAGQYVRVSSDAMSALSVVGHRERESEAIVSGWQVIAASTNGNESFGQYTVRQIAAVRPAWCVALALPAGWAFRFVGRTLIDCVSPGGETLTVNISVDV